MTLDLTVFGVDRETRAAVARFYSGMVEELKREGVEDWDARREAREMAVLLLLYVVRSDEDPPWRP